MVKSHTPNEPLVVARTFVRKSFKKSNKAFHILEIYSNNNNNLPE